MHTACFIYPDKLLALALGQQNLENSDLNDHEHGC